MLKAYLRDKHPSTFAIVRELRQAWLHALWTLRRRPYIRRYLARHEVVKLAIGASHHVREGWLNTDYLPQYRQGIVFLDATRRFPLADNSVGFIHSEHMIEHVSIQAAKGMVAECFRVMRPGGVIRTATPDLMHLLRVLTQPSDPSIATYIRQINGSSEVPYERERPDSPCIAFNRYMHAWGHQFLFDESTLCTLFEEAGFVQVQRCAINQSDHAVFRDAEMRGMSSDAERNAFETMVVEATKPSAARS